MAGDDTPSGNEEDQVKTTQGGLSRLLSEISTKLVPLLVSAAGFAGLVAFIGGIEVWSRFNAVQVPPDQAVDAMPNPELIVIGAVAMVVFGLAGLLAMTVAYVLDKGGRQTEGMARTLLLLGVIGGLVACLIADQNNGRAWWAAGAVTLLGLAILVLFGRYGQLTDDLPPTEEERAAAEAKAKWPDAPTEGLRRAQVEAAAQKAKDAARSAKRARKAANKRRDEAWYGGLVTAKHVYKSPDVPAPQRFRLRARGRFWAVGFAIACAVAVWLLLGEWWLGVAVPLAFGLTWAIYAVADGTGASFAWYGVALFFAVVLYCFYLAVADTVDDPKLQPAAVVRMNDEPGQGVLGIYITENKDRLYLATVSAGCGQTDVRHDSGRLFWIPKDDVRAVSIGRLQDVDDAAAAAPEMLRTLTAARVPGPKAQEDTATAASAKPKAQAKPKKKARSKKPKEKAKSSAPKSKQAAGRAKTSRRTAAEVDDESDPGDSPKSGAADVPAPAPAVNFAPKIKKMRIRGVPGDAPSTGRIGIAPGDHVVVEGEDFGSAPKVTVDDVRARVTSYPEREGNSTLEFRVPQKAESGRVEVRCGETGAQDLGVRHRPVPVVHQRRVGRNRIGLTALGSTDVDGRVVRYEWSLPGGKSKHGPVITSRRPHPDRPYDIELKLTDNGGLHATMEIEVRLGARGVHLDREMTSAVEAEMIEDPHSDQGGR